MKKICLLALEVVRNRLFLFSLFGLEPESQSDNWPTLVRVVKKIVLVIVDVQGAITTDQGNIFSDAVAKAPEQLVSELRPASAHIKPAEEENLLRQGRFAAQSDNSIHPASAGLNLDCRQDSGVKVEIGIDVPDARTAQDLNKRTFMRVVVDLVSHFGSKNERLDLGVGA